ncbi:MAG TPA: hypothetical protein VMT98_18700, partial [Verrucomicrobiae bacterium]|nr:hypothetical protein [Verrucomicrobiae bacterium]
MKKSLLLAASVFALALSSQAFAGGLDVNNNDLLSGNKNDNNDNAVVGNDNDDNVVVDDIKLTNKETNIDTDIDVKINDNDKHV